MYYYIFNIFTHHNHRRFLPIFTHSLLKLTPWVFHFGASLDAESQRLRSKSTGVDPSSEDGWMDGAKELRS